MRPDEHLPLRPVEFQILASLAQGERHGYAILEGDPSAVGYVFERAITPVSPQFVAAHLVDEINVQVTVAVHVGHRQAIAVIVMNRFVITKFTPRITFIRFRFTESKAKTVNFIFYFSATVVFLLMMFSMSKCQ